MKNISNFLAAYFLQDSFLQKNVISRWEICYFLWNNILKFSSIINNHRVTRFHTNKWFIIGGFTLGAEFFVSILFLWKSEKLSNFLFKYVCFLGGFYGICFPEKCIPEFSRLFTFVNWLLSSFSQVSNFAKINEKFAPANISTPKSHKFAQVSKILMLMFKDTIFLIIFENNR